MEILPIEAVIAHGLLLAGGLPDEVVAEALHLLLLRHRIHAAASGGGPGVGLEVMEFSDAVGGVARPLQGLHEGGDLGEQVSRHGEGPDLPAVAARDQGGPGRGADRVPGLAAGKIRVGSNPVDIGGEPLTAGVAHLVRALLVCHEKKNILAHSALLTALFLNQS